MNTDASYYRDQAENLKAIVYAIFALVAEGVIVYILHAYNVSPRLRPLILMVLALFPIIAGWWFLEKLTSFPRRIRHGIIRFWLAKDLRQAWMELVSAWLEYLKQGSEPDHWRIRRAIAKQYVEQEKLDLSGDTDYDNRRFNVLPQEIRKRRNPEKRPLIITSFVRYSKLVEAMVNAALDLGRRKHKNAIILCITTLSMGLEKWLNFDDKAHGTHIEWEKYLDFLRDALTRLTNDVVLARILLVCEGSGSNSRVNLQSVDELRSDLNDWVWLTKQSTDLPEFSALSALKPVDPETRRRVLSDLREQFVQDFSAQQSIIERGKYSAPDRDSYLTLPRSVFANKPPDISGGEFLELREAFKSTFQTRKDDGGYHAYYAKVDPKEYVPDPQTDVPPFPLDLFYVAMVEPQGTERVASDNLSDLPRTPLFCLAARPDAELHMVYLYLLDPTRCPRNFRVIDDYVTKLLVQRQPL